MKIGITERGDAGINLAWTNKINTVDGMVLITKNITEPFCQKVLELHNKGYHIVVHCTCTGYGSSALEPNVPNYEIQLQSLRYMIDRGFPGKLCVLRIDPIFPSQKGIKRVCEVLNHFKTLGLDKDVTRFRVSLVDEYKHVKARYRQHGWEPLYGNEFGPSYEQMQLVADELKQYPYLYELCAEDAFSLILGPNHCIKQGCISEKELVLWNLPVPSGMNLNPQNRHGCHCLSCKTEMLTERKTCPHQCVYCFWR